MVTDPPQPLEPTHGRWKLLPLTVGTLILASLGTCVWFSTRQGAAENAFARRNFSSARWNAEWSLRIWPSNSKTRIIAGDSYFLDDTLDSVDAATAAISHFMAVPKDNPQASAARTKAGRAAFLVLQEPSRAERYFQEAIDLDEDNFDAHYMLWQLYTVTERFFASEPQFREAYRLCAERDRPMLLREWYFSQFTPLSASGQLDFQMGFRSREELPSEEVALRRLKQFHQYEPDEPNTAAALAQWHLRNLSREEAVQVLNGIADLDAAAKSFFYQGTLVETLIEVGQIEQADEAFAKLEGDEAGYFLERIKGLHAQEVEGNLEKAEQAYRRAGTIWPGPTDWLLMNRHSRCLALLGRKEDADLVNVEAARVEGLTDLEVHRKIRESLTDLNSPENLDEVVKFYEMFHRRWEADEWRQLASALRKNVIHRDGEPR